MDDKPNESIEDKLRLIGLPKYSINLIVKEVPDDMKARIVAASHVDEVRGLLESFNSQRAAEKLPYPHL